MGFYLFKKNKNVVIIWLAPWVGKMKQTKTCAAIGYPSRQDGATVPCPLRTTRCSPQDKFPQKPYGKSFIDQPCSVKMDVSWPHSIFASLQTSKKITWPISIHLDLTLGQVNNPYVMHLSMSSPKGGGGRSGIGWGFWHFLRKIIKIPTPGQRIIVKISRNKRFTSHLPFKIDRSNAWCQVKIPTLGICITVKFPWVARPPPPPP